MLNELLDDKMPVLPLTRQLSQASADADTERDDDDDDGENA